MLIQKVKWKRGRVAYGVGLENRSVEMHREFESHRFRQQQCPCGQIGKVASLKRKSSLGSTPSKGTSFRMLTANFIH